MNPERKTVLVVVVVCALCQVMFAPYIAIGGVCPNFMLVATVCAAMMLGPVRGCVDGFVCGVVFDLATSGPIGAMALVLALVGYFVSFLVQNAFDGGLLAQMLALLVAAFFAEFALLVISCITGSATFFHGLVATVLPGTIYDTVFGLVCFPLVRRHRSRPGGGNIMRQSTSGMHVKNINLR